MVKKKRPDRYFPRVGDIVETLTGREGLIVAESYSNDIHHVTKYDILWFDTMKNDWTNREEFDIFEIERG